ncbi:MAG: TraR/DksA family transcriptional regulator [Phycisphaeraceae bacterium]
MAKKSSKPVKSRSKAVATRKPAKVAVSKGGKKSAARSAAPARRSAKVARPTAPLRKVPATVARNDKSKMPPRVAVVARGNGHVTSATPPNGHDLGDAGPLTEEQLRKIKSGLTKRELGRYRDVLVAKRAEILGDVDSLQADARNKDAGGDHFSPEHMADIGSDNWEQEFNLGLVESERKLLHEIVDALVRLDKGIYGICMETGKPIGKPRLDAKPWAKYCIEVVRDRERRGLA